MKRRILVTGASGFVGRALVAHLARREDVIVRGCYRQSVIGDPGIETCRIADIGPETDWTAALTDVDAIVHLAAHVHQRWGWRQRDAHFRVNLGGTRRLSECAVRAEVARIVYVSSIAVFGESAPNPITDASLPAPMTPYGQSKLAAEAALAEICAGTATDHLSLRPPLVYGRNAPGNFGTLMVAVRAGLPLPLAGIDAPRSMIARDNLVSAIERSLDYAGPLRDAFALADDTVFSAQSLAHELAVSCDCPVRLFRVPRALRPRTLARLDSSLLVDSSRFRQLMPWQPPVAPDIALTLG